MSAEARGPSVSRPRKYELKFGKVPSTASNFYRIEQKRQRNCEVSAVWRTVDDSAVYDSSGNEPGMIKWGETMTQDQLSHAKDKDLPASMFAMLRAARMAREEPVRTDTAIIVIRKGKPVRVTADELRKAGVR